jgi:hypothetical protein
MASQNPNTPVNPDEEEPLDPRLEAVAHKMRRLSMVSSGIMFLGVFAVLGSFSIALMLPRRAMRRCLPIRPILRPTRCAPCGPQRAGCHWFEA